MSEPFNDLELDEFLKELDNLSEEIDNCNLMMNEGFEWIDTLSGIKTDLAEFIQNMESLSITFKAISESKENVDFLIGTLWGGVISAQEGFLHQFFYRLLQKDSYLQMAISNIKSLPEKDLKRLKINPNRKISKKYINKLFQAITLNNPNTTTRLINHLFKINIPKICEAEMMHALNIRNAYTHKNGLINGKKITVPIKLLEEFHEKIDLLIANFVDGLLAQTEVFVNKDKV